MSVTGKRGVGIPVILLHDAEGGTVSVELKDGSIYTGRLEETQDNMNCTLKVRSFKSCYMTYLTLVHLSHILQSTLKSGYNTNK